MYRTKTVIPCLILGLSVMAPAKASIQFFDNVADFNTATAGFALQTELNPGLGVSGSGFTTPLGISVTSTDSGLSLNTFAGASNAIGFGTDFGGTTVTFGFSSPINAFGVEIFDAGDVGGTDITLTTALGSQIVFDDFVAPNANEAFAAAVSADDSFVSVSFTNSDPGDFVALDDIVFGTAPAPDPTGGAVPEPTMFIVWAGLACCGTLATRRRR